MPKWAGGIRPGRTTMDIYRLFTKEELADMTEEEIRARAEPALLYDAYREQEQHRAVYMGGRNLQGLEQVLYRCPHCGGEYTVTAKKNRLYCTACGYEQVSDHYGFLHNHKGLGEEIRYVSDWSRRIYEQVKEGLRRLIITGAIQEGEKLPSVRSLASSLAINPNTIQRAYEALEGEGYVYSIPGKGSFAAPRSEADRARKAELKEHFRTLAAELRSLGVSEEELCALIKEVST
jgi:GntR family transcriptional regulator